MKTVMFVLLSAAALLVQPQDARATPLQRSSQDHLNRILNLADRCSDSLIEDMQFVEDVSPLTEASSCGDKFFCKVEQILNKTHMCKNPTEESLKRNLREYHKHMGINCATELVGVSTTNEMQVSSLLQKVKECVRRKNFSGKNRPHSRSHTHQSV